MVFFLEALEQHVIDVHLHGFADQVCKDFINKVLLHCPNILQSEWHNLVAVDVMICSECHFIFIFEAHAYLVVTRVHIHETK